jgi:hypothetical protein
MEAIAMKCTVEEFESIKEFTGELSSASVYDFNGFNYIINRYGGGWMMFAEKSIIARKIYHSFDKTIVLKTIKLNNI